MQKRERVSQLTPMWDDLFWLLTPTRSSYRVSFFSMRSCTQAPQPPVDANSELNGWLCNSHGKCDENHAACYLTILFLGFLFWELGKKSLLTSVLREAKCRDKRAPICALRSDGTFGNALDISFRSHSLVFYVTGKGRWRSDRAHFWLESKFLPLGFP